MATLLENILWNTPSVYITDHQLAHALGGSKDSLYARLNRAVKKGQLIRVKRGLYCVSERLALKRPHPFELAQLIYGPSYISVESALSYHGLIPEAVHSITATTTKRNNEFKTPLGNFTYCRLPTKDFFVGVNHLTEGHHQFMLASPWKALLDYIYCYKKNWTSLEPVEHNLRIDLDDLPRISQKELERLQTFYHRNSIDRFIKNIPKEFINEHRYY